MGQSSIRRQRTKVVVLLLAALVSTVPANAWWRWNIDYWTIAQVGENTAAESGAEGIHNNTLTEQRKKQERIAEYTTAINVIRQLYKQSMQNTSGFVEESRYCQLRGENVLFMVI